MATVNIEYLLNKLLEGQTEIKVDISQLNKTVNNLQDDLNGFKQETTDKFTGQDERTTELEKKVNALEENERVRKEEQRKATIGQEMRDRRRNILIHGVLDPGTWETKETSLAHVQRTLKEVLEINEEIVIEDCHRLPQNPQLKAGKQLRTKTFKKR